MKCQSLEGCVVNPEGSVSYGDIVFISQAGAYGMVADVDYCVHLFEMGRSCHQVGDRVRFRKALNKEMIELLPEPVLAADKWLYLRKVKVCLVAVMVLLLGLTVAVYFVEKLIC